MSRSQAVSRNAATQNTSALSAEITECIDGVVCTSWRGHARQAAVYARLSCWLYTQVDASTGADGRWTYCNRGVLHIDGDVLVPEFAVWRAARLKLARDEKHATVVPDLVCEVRAPSPEQRDHLERKLPRYLAMGVPFVWLVDAVRGSIEVLELRAGVYRAFQQAGCAESVIRAMPLDNVPLDLARLFATSTVASVATPSP